MKFKIKKSDISNEEKLESKKKKAVNKLYWAMVERELNVLETSQITVRRSRVESSAAIDDVLTFNESGDLRSKIGEEGDFYYMNGDFHARIERPTKNEVIWFLESWPLIVDAFEIHDRRVLAAASMKLQDIPRVK